MESGDSPVAGCIIFLIFIILNSLLYGFSSAIQHVNEGEIEKKADQGDKKSITLLRMLAHPEDLINTIQVTATLLSMLIGVFLILGALSFLPALALGPIADYFTML